MSTRLGLCRRLRFGGNVSGVSSLGNYSEHNVNHNGFGNFTKIRGPHTFKFGATYDHYQKLELSQGENNQGSFQFREWESPPAAAAGPAECAEPFDADLRTS